MGSVHPVLWFAGAGLAGFLVFVLVENWIRRHQQQVMSLMSRYPATANTKFTLNTGNTAATDEAEKAADTLVARENVSLVQEGGGGKEELLVLCVMAAPGTCFASYDLLQAISAAGLRYGEMNIFHYFPSDTSAKKLFSLLSAEEPGEFSLDSMGDFSCRGLMLFMEPEKLPDPAAAFRIMLEKATQLAEDLNGEVKATPHLAWTDTLHQQYQHRLQKTQKSSFRQ